MFLLSFLLIPIIAAIVLLFIKQDGKAQLVAVGAALLSLFAAIYILTNATGAFDAAWLPVLNSRFVLQADGLSKILILLTAIAFPAIFIATGKNIVDSKNVFLSLMLFTQAGLMGVFLAGDALLFYFFYLTFDNKAIISASITNFSLTKASPFICTMPLRIGVIRDNLNTMVSPGITLFLNFTLSRLIKKVR